MQLCLQMCNKVPRTTLDAPGAKDSYQLASRIEQFLRKPHGCQETEKSTGQKADAENARQEVLNFSR